MVSSPRVSTGPADCRISRDYARRGWAAKTSREGRIRKDYRFFFLEPRVTEARRRMRRTGVRMEVRPSDATLRERNGRKEGDEATV